MNAPNFPAVLDAFRSSEREREHRRKRRQAWLDRPLNEAEIAIADQLLIELRNPAAGEPYEVVDDVHDHFASAEGMREFAELLRAVAEEDFVAARAALDKAICVVAKVRYENYEDFDARR